MICPLFAHRAGILRSTPRAGVPQVNQINDKIGAYVSLLEYGNKEGMINIAEVSKRRIRSLAKLLRVGSTEVLACIAWALGLGRAQVRCTRALIVFATQTKATVLLGRSCPLRAQVPDPSSERTGRRRGPSVRWGWSPGSDSRWPTAAMAGARVYSWGLATSQSGHAPPPLSLSHIAPVLSRTGANLQQPPGGWGGRGLAAVTPPPPETALAARSEDTCGGLLRTMSLPTGQKTKGPFCQLPLSRQGGHRARGIAFLFPPAIVGIGARRIEDKMLTPTSSTSGLALCHYAFVSCNLLLGALVSARLGHLNRLGTSDETRLRVFCQPR